MLDKRCKCVYNGSMTMFKEHPENELATQEQFTKTIIDASPSPGEITKGMSKAIADYAVEKAIDHQVRMRKLELQAWAEEHKFNYHPPTREDVRLVQTRLEAGWKLIQALKGVCTLATWRKWQEEYPFLAHIEEDAREARVAKLEEEVKRIADQEGREKMGQNTRDKIQIDTRLAEISRIDRLTENRNAKKQPGVGMVPIQINVAYGKDKTVGN